MTTSICSQVQRSKDVTSGLSTDRADSAVGKNRSLHSPAGALHRFIFLPLLLLLPSLALTGLSPTATAVAGAVPARIALLEVDINSYQVNQAINQLGLPQQFETRFYTLDELESPEAQSYLNSSSLIFVNVMMRELANYLIKNELIEGRHVYALNQAGDPEKLAEAGILFDPEVMDYYRNLTAANMAAMVRLGVHRHLDASVSYAVLVKLPEVCIHHPAAPGNFEELTDYKRWYAAKFPQHGKAEQPWVGILFYGSTLKEGQVEAADALILRLEEAGFNVLPCFGPVQQVLPKYFTLRPGRNGQSTAPVNLLLTFTMKFASGINDEIRKELEQLNVPLFNVIRPYAETGDEWRKSPVGLGPLETVWAVATPEFSSGIEPTVLIGKKELVEKNSGRRLYVYETIDETVDFLIPRLQNWTKLQRKSNSDKKVAVLYYNHSQGKQNIAASYLNVFRSLEVILQRMRDVGYKVEGSEQLSEEKLQKMVLSSGRNVGSWAPGELDELLASGGCEQVSLEEYRQWFGELPEEFREPVLAQWGEPEKSGIMTSDGKLVFPMVHLGNLVLLPEPARGWSDEPMKLYHDTTLYPHHQYIAAYLWLAKKFHVDAMVHLGTHATYEWLPGKQVGLAPSDPPEIMTGAIPNIYPYIVDDVGEGIQAKRRGRALILDHLTPPMREADLYNEYQQLHDLYHKYEVARANGGETSVEYMHMVQELIVTTGIQTDLGLAADAEIDEQVMEKVHLYLHEIDDNSLPYGLHTYGKAYDTDAMLSTLHLILKQNPDADPKAVRQALDSSAADEIDNFIRALDGEYVTAGEGNDPLRNLAAIPTGRNFYGFSPAKMPSKAAWAIGKRAAEEMIRTHREKPENGGKYPNKVGVVLWATEATRNEGVNESTVLYLIGVEPVWDATGRVTGTRVIPRRELGRPRIDVLINPSGLYRDMFPNLIVLLDQAVEKAMVQTDIDNFLAGNNKTITEALVASGMDRAAAEEQARFRIFTEEVGSYGNGVAEMTSASGIWEDDKAVSDVYLNRVQFGIRGDKWGVPMKKGFTEQLRGVDIAVHSRSSNVIGVIDTDDFFMYLGGMSLAVKNIRGEAPDTMVTLHRKKNELQVEDVARTIGREMRTRYLNPQWIAGMKKDNYGGARQMADFAENLWGWQVTVRDAVGADKWQQVYEVYVEDKYQMELAEFFDRNSPWAYQSLTARMLETVRKDYWQPSEDVKRRLAVDYAESVVKRGVACCDHTCNNPMLNQMVATIISIPGVAAPELAQQFKLAIEKMAKKSLEQQVVDRQDLLQQLAASRNARSQSDTPQEAEKQPQPSTQEQPQKPEQAQAAPEKSTANSDPATPTENSKKVEGYKMEDLNRQDSESALTSSGVQWFASAFVLLLVALFFMGLKRRKDI